MNKSWYSVNNTAGVADVYIYDEIGFFGITAGAFAKDFQELLDKGSSAIHVHINSPGGVVPEGLAIYNTIRRAKDRVTVFVEGWAASIASVVAMAGSRVEMSENAMFMIHNPRTLAFGESKDFQKISEDLAKHKQSILLAYSRSNLSEAELSAAMDDETWYSANEALNAGFVDSVTEELQSVAMFDPNSVIDRYGFQKVRPSYLQVFSQQEGDRNVNTSNAIAEWDRAIATAIAGGMDKKNATRAVVRNNPDLHTRYLAEYQARKRGSVSTDLPKDAADAIAEFERAVREIMRTRNCTQSQANRAIAKERPDVHKAYIAAFNQKHNAAYRRRAQRGIA